MTGDRRARTRLHRTRPPRAEDSRPPLWQEGACWCRNGSSAATRQKACSRTSKLLASDKGPGMLDTNSRQHYFHFRSHKWPLRGQFLRDKASRVRRGTAWGGIRKLLPSSRHARPRDGLPTRAPTQERESYRRRKPPGALPGPAPGDRTVGGSSFAPIAPYAKDARFEAAVWHANSRYHSMEGHIPGSWRFAAQGELRADGGGCGR